VAVDHLILVRHMRPLISMTLLAFASVAVAAGDKPPAEVFLQSQFAFTVKIPSGFKQTASNTGYFPTPMGNVPYEEKAWESKGDTISTKVTVMPEAWWRTRAGGAFAEFRDSIARDPHARLISQREYIVGGCRAYSLVLALSSQFQRIDQVLTKPDLRVVMYLSPQQAALSAPACSSLFESISISSGPQITSGSIENGRYTNSFFRFSILIPADWKSMSEEEYAERLGRVQKFVNKQNSRIKEDLIAGPTAIPVILRVSPKNDLKGEARTFSILAQDLSGHAPISPEEYLNQSKEEYSQFQGVSGGFAPFYHIQCPGADLTACDLTMHGNSVEGYMTFAVTSRQGYLLSFVLAARTSAAHKRVKEMLNTLTFQ
jgi:hypothetical protein